MKPKGTETILSDENKSLKEKIKSLQAEVRQLKQQEDRDNLVRGIVWLVGAGFILVCLYPFFKLGLALLTLN